jgi:hypothetical protein
MLNRIGFGFIPWVIGGAVVVALPITCPFFVMVRARVASVSPYVIP